MCLQLSIVRSYLKSLQAGGYNRDAVRRVYTVVCARPKGQLTHIIVVKDDDEVKELVAQSLTSFLIFDTLRKYV